MYLVNNVFAIGGASVLNLEEGLFPCIVYSTFIVNLSFYLFGGGLSPQAPGTRRQWLSEQNWRVVIVS